MDIVLPVSIFNRILRACPYKTMTVNCCRTFRNCAYTVNNYTYSANKAVRYSTDRRNTATYEEIKGIGSSQTKSIFLIDVREPKELQETGVIPGSINIPLGHVECALKDMSNEEFQRKYGREKPSLDNPIIFSCRSGKRGVEALALSQQLGYKNVKNYAGGWMDWEEKSK